MKHKLWRKLGISLISPRFHGQILYKRLASSLCSPYLFYNLKSWFFLSTMLGVVALTNAWVTFLLVWVVPLTILYQISATLRLCAEHIFPEHQTLSPTRNKSDYARLTTGIFLGESPPEVEGKSVESFSKWSWWWLKMIFFHFLFCRVFVMVGDTPVHDFHHRYPTSKDWPNAIFARQQDLEQGCPGLKEDYREVWGLFQAIDLTFASLIRFKQANSLIKNS